VNGAWHLRTRGGNAAPPHQLHQVLRRGPRDGAVCGAGEVHALVGENGVGESTPIRTNTPRRRRPPATWSGPKARASAG